MESFFSPYRHAGAYLHPGYRHTDIYRGVNQTVDVVEVTCDIISMLCVDGVNGGTFEAGPFRSFPLAVTLNGVNAPASEFSWDVVPSGICHVDTSAYYAVVIADAPGTCTVTATHGLGSSSCQVTAFATLPSLDDRYSLPGGSGMALPPGAGPSSTFVSQYAIPSPLHGIMMDLSLIQSDSLLTIFQCLYTSYNNPFFLRVARSQDEGVFYSGSGSNWNTAFYSRPTPGASPYRTNVLLDSNSFSLFLDQNPHPSLPSSTGSERFSPVDLLQLDIPSSLRKIVLASSAESNISIDTLKDWSQCELYYVPQCFIRYRFQGVTQFIRMPNLGTFGPFANMNSTQINSAFYTV